MLNQINFKCCESKNQDHLFTKYHKKYKCTISYNGKQFTFDYQCNPHYTEPSKFECLQSIILDMEAYDYNGDLASFMWEYGYEQHAINEARRIFNACKHTSNRLHKMFTLDELDTLAELTRE